jgi:hypothetical protein
VFSTNSLVGRTYSSVYNEEPCCCDMGPVGICLCVSLIPLGVYTPAGGAGIYCCLSNCLRKEVTQKYKITDEPDCGKENHCLNFIFYGLNYPCSFFQMISTIQYYERKNGGTGGSDRSSKK